MHTLQAIAGHAGEKLQGKTITKNQGLDCYGARTEAIMGMLAQYHWWGQFTAAMKYEETKAVGIAACGWDPTDGTGTLYFHPDNFQQFDIMTRIFFIAHEVTHWTNLHVKSSFIMMGPLANYAADMADNDLLKMCKILPTHPEEFLYSQSVFAQYAAIEPGLKPLPEERSFEFYLNWLLDRRAYIRKNIEKLCKQFGLPMPQESSQPGDPGQGKPKPQKGNGQPDPNQPPQDPGSGDPRDQVGQQPGEGEDQDGDDPQDQGQNPNPQGGGDPNTHGPSPAQKMANDLYQGVAPGLQDKLTDHHHWKELTETEKDLITQHIVNHVERTNKTAQPPGDVAAFIAGLIEAAKPILDWRRALKSWAGMCGGMSISTTRARLNKYKQTPKVMLMPTLMIEVWQDTSGSVGDDQLAQFYGEMEGIAKTLNIEMYLGQVDVAIHSFEKFRVRPKAQSYGAEGRGGTDMRNIFHYRNQKKNKHTHIRTDGLIIMTDGFTPWPAPKDLRGRKVLWVITSTGGMEDFARQSGIGKAIYLDLAQQKRK